MKTNSKKWKKIHNYELITCIKNNILVVKHDMSVEKMNKEKNNDFKEIRNVGVIIDIKFKGKWKNS